MSVCYLWLCFVIWLDYVCLVAVRWLDGWFVVILVACAVRCCFAGWCGCLFLGLWC